MYNKGSLEKIDPSHLLTTYSQDLAEFLIENGIIPLKNDKGAFHYIKSKKVEKLVKKYNKKGGKLF